MHGTLQVEVRFKSMASSSLTISELAQRTGLAPSALRYYERCGLIEPVGRAGGKRVYGARAVEQIALVDLLKISGFTLAEIAELIDPDGRVGADWRDRAAAKRRELEAQMSTTKLALTMIEHTLECPHQSLDECPVHRRIVRDHAAAMSRPPTSDPIR
jgi:DNA-binding transcriptional MerR regulator